MDILATAPPRQLGLREIWQTPMPHCQEDAGLRFLVRLMTTISLRYVLQVRGDLSNISPRRDPFVFVLNHNMKHESVLIPTLLFLFRKGMPIHFVADWNFLMMPFVATLYRKSQVIISLQKSARPKILNVFKPLFRGYSTPPFEMAQKRIAQGRSVGLFPEGTMNRHPSMLMRGRPGAAKLSLMTGAPIVTAGIRFPDMAQWERIPDGGRMILEIGDPIEPPDPQGIAKPPRAMLLRHHTRMMCEIARLSGKTWRSDANKRRKYVL